MLSDLRKPPEPPKLSRTNSILKFFGKAEKISFFGGGNATPTPTVTPDLAASTVVVKNEVNSPLVTTKTSTADSPAGIIVKQEKIEEMELTEEMKREVEALQEFSQAFFDNVEEEEQTVTQKLECIEIKSEGSDDDEFLNEQVEEELPSSQIIRKQEDLDSADFDLDAIHPVFLSQQRWIEKCIEQEKLYLQKEGATLIEGCEDSDSSPDIIVKNPENKKISLSTPKQPPSSTRKTNTKTATPRTPTSARKPREAPATSSQRKKRSQSVSCLADVDEHQNVVKQSPDPPQRKLFSFFGWNFQPKDP